MAEIADGARVIRFSDYNRKDGGFAEFNPVIVDSAYLDAIGVTVSLDPIALADLRIGSEAFQLRFRSAGLGPAGYVETEIPYDQPMEVHNYTGKCPTNTYEVNPVLHSCQVGCLYCLVNDGDHNSRPGTLYVNYASYMRNWLSTHGSERVFYYFSPKSEAFQEATLETGIAHDILREFARHFKSNPESQARIFIASKAGIRQLHSQHKGQTILELLHALRGRVQFNPSIGIMPAKLFDLFEPNAGPVRERLAASRLCQEHGVKSDSVLAQPVLLPSVREEVLVPYFALLADSGIVNFKPEFLTVSTRNLAALAQLVASVDPKLARDLLHLYLAPSNRDHIKHRERRAPEKTNSRRAMEVLVETAASFGITTSICHWVRQQLEITEGLVPLINSNGYQCLGYQTRLFDAVC